MVFAGQGSAAPRVGTAYPQYAEQVNPNRAVAALVGAGVISAAAASGLASEGRTFENNYQRPPEMTRSAPPASTGSTNPLLQGASGQSAPRLPSTMPTMPSASTAMPSASGAMPPIRGGPGLAGAAAALGSAALEKGLGSLGDAGAKGNDPLSKFRRALGNAQQMEAQRQADEQAAMGRFWRDLGDEFKKREKQQRKGDKVPRNSQPTNVGDYKFEPEATYDLDWMLEYETASGEPLTDLRHNGFRGSEGINFEIRGAAVYLNGYKVADFGGGQKSTGHTVVAIRRQGGDQTPIPRQSVPPYTLDPATGAPIQLGLVPFLETPSVPAAPAAKQNAPSPARRASPGDNVPTASNPAAATPTANPSSPAPGEPTKGAEPQPSQPGSASPANMAPTLSGVPSLPSGLPASPATGTATTTNPLFPSPFAAVPGTRNPEALQPIEPPKPEPQPKPGCADPCMATIQNALPPLADSLGLLDELLNQLLAGQQQQMEQQEEEKEKNELITINVPVCSCNDDGTASMQDVAIQVLASQEVVTMEQFSTLAAMQAAQCKMQRHTERAHNILGGDVWFEDAASRNPAFNTRIERKVKEAGTLFGFPAMAAETGTPSTAGQMTAHNIIELINGYTSNLYHRAGFQGLPTSVPKTLLGYTDDEAPETINDLSTYFVWFVKQVDALIGKFPINITIEDVDPLTQGNQTKEIELPNIAEALAEMYGVNIATSVNADVTVNFLMRLASELIATKNASLITQDYAKANAAFLGYKGNPARREIDYSFNPSKLDSLDEFLKESKGYLVGWEEDDKESVVGFLQRIVFSAGIIKSVFMRDKKRLLEFQKEVESMMQGDKATSEAEWNALLALFNDPTDYFNKDSIPQPRVRDKPASSTGGNTP